MYCKKEAYFMELVHKGTVITACIAQENEPEGPSSRIDILYIYRNQF
jgi:hypothetical protein